MINTQYSAAKTRGLTFKSPPRTKVESNPVNLESFDSVSLSDARAKSGPGMSTLQKVGLTIGVTAAVGGAFVAGVHFTEQAQETDLERDLGRDFEDFKTDWKRGVEDFKTEFRRGYEDAREGEPSEERQLQRDWEDARRELKRESQDAGKEIKRAWQDLWN